MPPTVGGSRRRRPKVGLEAVDHRGANLGDQAEDLVAEWVHQGRLAIGARRRLRGLSEAYLLEADRTPAFLGSKSGGPISMLGRTCTTPKATPGPEENDPFVVLARLAFASRIGWESGLVEGLDAVSAAVASDAFLDDLLS